jgi:hypothetical protein
MNSRDQAASPAAGSAANAKAARGKALMWWGAAALVLIAGYADLWRGSESVAPILLVLGYCVLIPVAILK